MDIHHQYKALPLGVASSPESAPVSNNEGPVIVDEGPYEFQCMNGENSPVLDLDGQPVIVSEPQQCHQYFMDFASFADPDSETVFMEEAHIVFKSNLPVFLL